MSRIAIIGGGNMGEALLAGLLRSGHPARDVVVAEKMAERAALLSQTYSVRTASVSQAIENATMVIVAVKPGDVQAAVSGIAEVAAKAAGDSVEQVVVSVVAGITTAYYEARLPVGSPVIRAMPNTPALVGAGVTAVAKGRFATDDQLEEAAELFTHVGAVHTVTEAQLDAVTAVSGSGPAYFFLMVEALVDAGVAAGLSRPIATDLAVQTMAGSAKMLTDRIAADRTTAPGGPDTAAAALRALVTSPGGTTAAGLRELERGGVRAALAAAVEAAKTRSEQLGITSE